MNRDVSHVTNRAEHALGANKHASSARAGLKRQTGLERPEETLNSGKTFGTRGGTTLNPLSAFHCSVVGVVVRIEVALIDAIDVYELYLRR